MTTPSEVPAPVEQPYTFLSETTGPFRTFETLPLFAQVAVLMQLPNPTKGRDYHTMEDLKIIVGGGATWALDVLKKFRPTTPKDPEKHKRLVNYVWRIIAEHPAYRAAFQDAVRWVQEERASNMDEEFVAHVLTRNAARAKAANLARMQSGTVRPLKHHNRYTGARFQTDTATAIPTTTEPRIESSVVESDEPLPTILEAHPEPATPQSERLTFVETAKRLDRVMREIKVVSETLGTLAGNLEFVVQNAPLLVNTNAVQHMADDLTKFQIGFAEYVAQHTQFLV